LLDAIDRVDLVTGCRAGRAPWWWRGLAALLRGVIRVLFGLTLPPRLCWLGASGWGRRWLARWVFGVRVQDPECAFRLFRRSVFRRLPIQTDGDFAQVEILAKANFLGHLLDEVQVSHRPAGAGDRLAAGPPQHLWRDVRRLFTAADFGPVTLPPEEVAPAAEPTAEQAAAAVEAPPGMPPAAETEP
jgi:hypothetical protein